MIELCVRGIEKHFGALHALRDAGFSVKTGEVLGLLGPNGAGKSTLLECVAGLLPCERGDVTWNGVIWPASRRRDGLFFLPDGIRPWSEQSVSWLLSWSAQAFGAANEDVCRDVARSLRIDELLSRPIGELSKGQRKRVLLAMALSSSRLFVFMDEPFDGLDLRQTRDAIALLRRMADAGRGIVVSIHAMLDAERVCDRLALLHDGHVIAEGTPHDLRQQSGVDGGLDDVFLALT